MSHQRKHIVIIGAGIGGLSAAIHLAAQGYTVQMLERQAQVGGKLNQMRLHGFSFDTGPSLITMPYVLRDLFAAAQRRIEDYLDLIPLEITCRYFYRDGLIINAWRGRERLQAEYARINAHDGEALHRFFEYAHMLFEAAADPFLYHSLGSPLDVLSTFIRYVLHGHPVRGERGAGAINLAPTTPYYGLHGHLEGGDAGAINRAPTGIWGRLWAVLAAMTPTTLDQTVRHFFSDPHLRQLFDRYATYNGSSPYRVASVYSIIPYVEMADGGWYPRGGMYALAQALQRLAHGLGVCIETECDVARILVEHDVAHGVVLTDGRVVRCDTVIANSDVVTAHRTLLSPAQRPHRLVSRLERLEPSCSGFVLLVGTNKLYPQLSHHNIFFSDDYPAEFADLFTHRVPLRNPTIYVCASTRTDATQAPAGHENLFILVNAPYLTEKSNWQRDAPMYRDHILDLLASYRQLDLGDIREHIVCEAMLTPEDFQRNYGANAGSIYGLSSNNHMAPFTRPSNRSQAIQQLYFVGGSTHPGGGVPLVMLSGKIVADMIARDGS